MLKDKFDINYPDAGMPVAPDRELVQLYSKSANLDDPIFSRFEGYCTDLETHEIKRDGYEVISKDKSPIWQAKSQTMLEQIQREENSDIQEVMQTVLPTPTHWWEIEENEYAKKLDSIKVFVKTIVRNLEIKSHTVPRCWYKHPPIVFYIGAIHDYYKAVVAQNKDSTAWVNFYFSLEKMKDIMQEYVSGLSCVYADHISSKTQDWAVEEDENNLRAFTQNLPLYSLKSTETIKVCPHLKPTNFLVHSIEITENEKIRITHIFIEQSEEIDRIEINNQQIKCYWQDQRVTTYPLASFVIIRTQLNAPLRPVLVSDPQNLTESEKTEIKQAVAAANPGIEHEDLKVDDKGNVYLESI